MTLKKISPIRTLAILKSNHKESHIATFYFEMVCEHSVSVSRRTGEEVPPEEEAEEDNEVPLGLELEFPEDWSPYAPGEQIQPENQLGIYNPSAGKTVSDPGQSN